MYKTVCPYDCPDSCSVLVAADYKSCRGDPDNSYTQGFLCGKGRRYPKVVFSPERFPTPLRRSGPKGAGIFRAITWDEALAEVAAQTENTWDCYGGSAILPYSSAGTMGVIQGRAGEPLFNALGALRLQDTICSAAGEMGFNAILGRRLSADPETVSDGDLIIIWGANPASTRQHIMPFILSAKRRGAQVVVVDPYQSRTVRWANWHLRPRPGTDTALVLGLMYVLWHEGLVDKNYLRTYTIGFPELVKQVLPRFTPSQVETITGVPAAEVTRLARAYAAAQAPFLLVGHALSRYQGAGQLFRALATLPALLGVYGRERGGIIFSTSQGFPIDWEAVYGSDLCTGPRKEFNMLELGKALDPDAAETVRLLFVYNANPAATCPDQKAVRRGLMRTDLFTVVLEHFVTETALYADILLPATTAWEHADLYTSYGHYWLQWADKIMSPRGQARSNCHIFQQLARRLGFSDPMFYCSAKDLAQQAVRRGPDGLNEANWQALWQGKPVKVLPKGANPFAHGFPTSSGKVEIYSAALAAQGLPPLPDYIPTGMDRDGLTLISAHPHEFINTSQVPLARGDKCYQDLAALFNPADAATFGLTSGQQVQLKSDSAEMVVTAKITAAVLQGTVVIQGIVPVSAVPGPTVNTLTPQELCDFGLGSTFSGIEVYPMTDPFKT